MENARWLSSQVKTGAVENVEENNKLKELQAHPILFSVLNLHLLLYKLFNLTEIHCGSLTLLIQLPKVWLSSEYCPGPVCNMHKPSELILSTCYNNQ
jgi:hypothetical protein